MIITLKKNTPKEEVDKLASQFESQGLRINLSPGENYVVLD